MKIEKNILQMFAIYCNFDNASMMIVKFLASEGEYKTIMDIGENIRYDRTTIQKRVKRMCFVYKFVERKKLSNTVTGGFKFSYKLNVEKCLEYLLKRMEDERETVKENIMEVEEKLEDGKE